MGSNPTPSAPAAEAGNAGAAAERRGHEHGRHRARRRERWVQRAEKVSDAFGLVLLLVLTTYVLASLLSNHGWSAVILTVATSATSVIALTSSHARAASGPRRDRALGADDRPRRDRRAQRRAHSGSTSPRSIQILLLAIAMAAVLRRVVTTAEVGSARSSARSASTPCSASSSPSSTGRSTGSRARPFFEGVPHPAGSDFLFFSYTTLTTTGYGNLVPGGQPGRMLSGLEMMIGQIFLVTLVAGLVSLWRPGEALRRRARRSAPRAESAPAAKKEPPAAEPAAATTGG